MADDAEDVGLGAVGVEGVTHRLAVEGQSFIGGGMLRIPPCVRIEVASPGRICVRMGHHRPGGGASTLGP